MNDLVSVILAVYNAEKFIEEGLDSVLNQTYPHLEIVAVNDCSPDSSLDILNEYAARDSRVKVISHEKNQGPGPARNTGISVSTGKYIAFLDPDDILLPDAIEKLHAVASQNNSDAVKGTALKINHSGKVKGVYSKFVPDQPVINTNIREYKDLWMSTEFWTYLYKRELFEGIEFLPVRLGEDFLFLFQVLNRVERLSIIPDIVHKYRQNPSSLTRVKAGYSDCLDALVGYKALFDFYSEVGLDGISRHRAYYQTKLLMSTFVAAADGFSLEQCSKIFAIFKATVEENDMKIVETSQPFVFKYTCLLLQEGLFEEAYLLLKRFHGRYRERFITNVYLSLAWESYKIRLRRKCRRISLLNRLFQ